MSKMRMLPSKELVATMFDDGLAATLIGQRIWGFNSNNSEFVVFSTVLMSTWSTVERLERWIVIRLLSELRTKLFNQMSKVTDGKDIPSFRRLICRDGHDGIVLREAATPHGVCMGLSVFSSWLELKAKNCKLPIKAYNWAHDKKMKECESQ